MPRSWPSTEADPTGGYVEPTGTASERRGASSIEIEVIDLDPVRPASSSRLTPARTRSGWLLWVMIVVLVGGGLALLPGQTVEPSNTAAQPLPEPEMATTTTTLAVASRAEMSGDTFSLLPASGLDGFVQFAGPIEFDGKYWIAGNRAYPSAEVSVLSSVDGIRWDPVASVSAEDGEWLRIEDLDSFGGVLMAVGVVGQVNGPAYAPPTSGSLVLWKSADGSRWSPLPIIEEAGTGFGGLQFSTSSGEVLITGQRSNAFDASVLSQFPPELLPGLERGDFNWWYDSSSIVIVAPPGIELFRMPVPISAIPFSRPLPASESTVLLRSDNLMVWEDVPVAFSAGSVATTLDGGFLSNDYEGHVMYSADGRSWETTNSYPPLFYQSWGDRLVGLDFSVSRPNLMVFDGDQAATIELPAEITDYQYGISITPGPPGLATVLGSYEGVYAEPMTQAEGYILVMENGVLRIQEPSGETTSTNFGSSGLIKGTYVPETDSIRFANTDGSKTFEFPVAVLLELRGRALRGLFSVFLSEDGLTWARPQTGVRAEYAEILGGAGETFLVGLYNSGLDYRQLPITVYRTGPVG